MATLSIKNLPDDLYDKLQARARQEHRSVVEEVIHLLEKALEEPGTLSILELQGLGADLWVGTDATEHVERERRAWD